MVNERMEKTMELERTEAAILFRVHGFGSFVRRERIEVNMETTVVFGVQGLRWIGGAKTWWLLAIATAQLSGSIPPLPTNHK